MPLLVNEAKYMNNFSESKYNDYLDVNNNGQNKSAVNYKDCKDALNTGQTESGVYTIYPAGTPISVSCDMETEGGRMDGK